MPTQRFHHGMHSDVVLFSISVFPPRSYDDIRSIFGMHLDWILFIALLAAICWGYIKYIRPQLHLQDEV